MVFHNFAIAGMRVKAVANTEKVEENVRNYRHNKQTASGPSTQESQKIELKLKKDPMTGFPGKYVTTDERG